MLDRTLLPPIVRDVRFRLAVVIAGIIPTFAITLVIVGRYKDERAQLAQEWAARGDRDLSASPAAAVADFRSALPYAPDDTDTRLHLAEALIASGEREQARGHLLTLWAAEPGDGRVNLDLARLAAADGDVTAATRYYHAAIDGAWDNGATAARRAARLELAKFLLQKGQTVRAQSELIALIDDLPDDPPLITELGSLLVAAGAETRSIGLFERALALDPRDARAAQLEAEVQMHQGRYQTAHDLFLKARRNGASLPPDDETALAATSRMPDLDPLAARLTTRQRLQRALDSLSIARGRIARCQTISPQAPEAGRVSDLSQQVDAFGKIPRRRLERDPDQVTDIINLVMQVEALPPQMCGPDTADDRALQLIAGEHRLQIR